MKQLIKDLIASLEEAEGPSAAIDMEIAQLTRLSYRAYSGSVDAALELTTLAPGWYIEHTGDNAMGEAGNLRVFGHAVELSNEIETVQGDAPTRPLAYCLAIMKAYLAEWEAAERRIIDMLSADDRVSPAIIADVTAVISNFVAPFSVPEAEIDEDDHSIVLRWVQDGNSFSLSFFGKGFVCGYLIHPTAGGPAFRHEVGDSTWLTAVLNREAGSHVTARPMPEKPR
ncbi:hypothetical protein GOB57_07860 [Sinorhizobium meliloti]|nr:hypothetical protein [Sinorhizobium meliloti]